jgi:hypothetical protein
MALSAEGSRVAALELAAAQAAALAALAGHGAVAGSCPGEQQDAPAAAAAAAASAAAAAAAAAASLAPRRHLPAPYCCWRAWRAEQSGEYLRFTTLGVLQFVALRVLLAVLQAALSVSGGLCEGSLASPACAFPYLVATATLSQLHALYCLALFARDLSTELRPLSPTGKAACVALAAFALYWQGALLSALGRHGAIGGTRDFAQRELEAQLGALVVACQALAGAVAFSRCFAVGELQEGSAARSARRPGRVDVFEYARGGECEAAPLGALQAAWHVAGLAAWAEAGRGVGKWAGEARARAAAAAGWGGGRAGEGAAAAGGAADAALPPGAPRAQAAEVGALAGRGRTVDCL